jgi:hypothetical protein
MAALTACVSPPPPVSVVARGAVIRATPPAPRPAPRPSVAIDIALESAPVDEAVREVATRAGRTLVIDPTAERYASCARVSLTTPGPVPDEEALLLLAHALAPSGLRLGIRDEELVLAHYGVPVPEACPQATTAIVGAPEHPEIDGSTREISETEWEITRAWRDSVALDPTAIATGVRLNPHEVDGRVIGMGLHGFRRSSVFGALGFRYGDTLLTINGIVTRNPVTAFEALEPLRTADRYEVVLERRGITRTHVIRVVESLSPRPPGGRGRTRRTH